MHWSDSNIIFLVSLPRAGSTLLQRILTAHPSVHSTAESWLLLPQLYSLHAGQVFAEYGHTHAVGAIDDFCKLLPEKKQDYYQAINNFAVELFQSVTPDNKQYYLEKTPKNILVIDELMEIFPNSKFVFLWRNPLASAASIIETFGGGRWNLFKYTIDLYEGLDNMIKTYQDHSDRITTIQYEELLTSPEQSIEKLLKNLDLEVSHSLLEKFQNVSFKGRMGDPTGIKQYSSLSKEPLEKWKKTLATPTRYWWAKNYLEWLGTDRLSVMNYDYTKIEQDLKSITLNADHLTSDLIRMSYGYLERKLQLKMFRHLIRTRHDRKMNHRYF